MTKTNEKEFNLEHAYLTLFPWWSDFNEKSSPLATQTQTTAESFFDRLYLFPLSEISVNNVIEDIPLFINEHYQTILSASYQAGISVATIIKGNKGKIEVFLGFAAENDTNIKPEYFQSIINGVLPGEKIGLKETLSLSTLVKDLPKGGIVTGIPVLENEDRKQQFNLSSVVRSMYGREYVLVILATPIPRSEMKQRLAELIVIRDECHELSKITVGEEKGTGSSKAENEQVTIGKSQPQKGNWNLILFAPRGSATISENKTKGNTETVSEQSSHSLSFERQNGVAIELEKIADHLIERMLIGFNTGYWETAITFAAKDKISCDILGGSFIGELSKPSEKLYPPRLYTGDIDTQKLMFLPKTDATNRIFPKSLASYLASQELSQLASPPTESLPGYEIKQMPPFALSDIPNQGEIPLGIITDYGQPVDGSSISLSRSDLNKHLFVCGLTGSGKTTTIKHILKSISQKEPVPFLVLESAKRDYRQLLADNIFKDNLNIFTIGDATVSPIRFNPFYIQMGVHPLVHIDYLKAIFNASFSLYGPMPHIVEKCLHGIYLKRGWNLTTGKHPNFIDSKGEDDESRYDKPEHHYCFPTLTDLKDEVNTYVKNELEYKGELRDNIRTAIVVRLESLCVGAKGLMFNTYDFFPLATLLNRNTILEMENLADDDDKAFFVGLMLVLISEYRQRDNPAVNPGSKANGLQHFMVIEEAHRLLKNVNTDRTSEMMGNPKGKAVDVFCNVISEMRALGQGVAVVEQIPTKISPDVIKNSNTKIVHRLVSKDDQALLAGSLSISDKDALYLNRLKTGHALCHKEGMERPVECVVLNDVKTHAISDHRVSTLMNSRNLFKLHSFCAYELSDLLADAGKELVIRFFNSLCTAPSATLPEILVSFYTKLRKLLVMNNWNTATSDDIAVDYLVKCVFELLSKGIYCKHPKFPDNLKELLAKVAKTADAKLHRELLVKLSQYWDSDVAKYIDDVVENLSCKYLLQKQSTFALETVIAVASSFYLLPDNRAISELSHRIIAKYEVNNG